MVIRFVEKVETYNIHANLTNFPSHHKILSVRKIQDTPALFSPPPFLKLPCTKVIGHDLEGEGYPAFVIQGLCAQKKSYVLRYQC